MPASPTESASGPRPGALSLASRLMLWFSATTVLLIGLAVSLLYWSLIDHFHREDEAYAADKITVIRHQLVSSPVRQALLESTVIGDPLVRKNLRMFLKIFTGSPSGSITTPGYDQVVGDHAAELWRSPPIKGTDIHALRIVGSDHATYLLAGSPPDRAAGGLSILLAFNNRQADALFEDYRRCLALVMGLTAICCVMIGYVLVRRGMRPLVHLTAEIEAISSSSLHTRLRAGGQPLELISLIASFNAMLDRLDQSFQRITRFSSDIAHELRTPLNNIMGTVEVSLQRQRSSAEYQEVLSSGLEEINRLARLVDKLLFLARSEHPEFIIAHQRLDVARELDVMHSFYLTIAEEAKVRFSCFCEQQLVISGERDLFHSAIGNLIENSLAYTRPGGEISIKGCRSGANVIVRVSDTGMGIAPEHLPKVFDRLYRADQCSDGASHNGLGLSIVKTIIQLHGGTVTLDSSLGRGTAVELRFPSKGAPSLEPDATG
jgi:two-component system heavy metal sensor histidine kinase CusS